MHQPSQARDLLGYAGSPPHPHWPGGARVAVSIVVNFEEGAEFSVTDGDTENEAVYEVEQPVLGQPNPAIDSHFEYGSRAGGWRIMAMLGQHNAPATVSSSGRAVERLPLLAQDAVRRGHEISAHGWRWEGHADLGEAEERDRIARTRGGDKDRDRNKAGRLAYAVPRLCQHAASPGRGRRVPL
jgi:peptidoglycan/xylan/chitin deacetylase (PgdA/CDA1 family)